MMIFINHAISVRSEFLQFKDILKMKLDGCRNVFIDVGANKGNNIEALYDEAYAKGMWRKTMNHYFGHVSERRKTTCSVGIEPNPNHEQKLMEIQRRHRFNGIRTTMLTMVAELNHNSDKEAFFVDNLTSSGRQHDEWGSTLFNYVGIQTKPAQVSQAIVKSIDLAQWIQLSVFRRKIPPYTSRRQPTVLMKIDAEGADFKILPRLLISKVLCSLNAIFVEFHDERVPGFTSLLKQNGTPHNFQSNFEYMIQFAQHTPRCNVTFNHISASQLGS